MSATALASGAARPTVPSLDQPAQVKTTLRYQVETPENVLLTYQLAGPAQRCMAYIIDTLVRVVILVMVGMFVSCSGFMLPGMSTGLFLLVVFFCEWGYFVLSETLMNGRSIGKKVFGLRVIQNRGYTITFWSSLSRNLLRGADVLPMFYGAGFVSMLLTRKFQRLGDLLAGTIVVQERTIILPREPVILQNIPPLDRKSLSHFTPPERTLALIDQFLGRWEVIKNDQGEKDYSRGHDICRQLAIVLAQRLNYDPDKAGRVRKFAMSFLAEVYVTFLKSDKKKRPPRDEESEVREERGPRNRRRPPQQEENWGDDYYEDDPDDAANDQDEYQQYREWRRRQRLRQQRKEQQQSPEPPGRGSLEPRRRRRDSDDD